MLICGGVYEVRTRREALFPVTVFTDPTTSKSISSSILTRSAQAQIVIILVVTFLHNIAFNAGTFYLALYYQVSAVHCATVSYLIK